MENSSFYTKGDREEIISRIGQVHTITMFCPIEDTCIQSLKNSFEMMIPKYKTSDNRWDGVPCIDALGVFLFTTNFLRSTLPELDIEIIGVIASSLKMFKKLKKINFEFTDNTDIKETYEALLQKKKEKMKKCIYSVDVIEMNFSDMFSQTVIDLINKIFVYNELIPNSYLERKFKLDFNFDEYSSFMSMFINNNRENLDALDKKICDYLQTFPPLVIEQKPKIRLLTNYAN